LCGFKQSCQPRACHLSDLKEAEGHKPAVIRGLRARSNDGPDGSRIGPRLGQSTGIARAARHNACNE
jgi:hypothetical protein